MGFNPLFFGDKGGEDKTDSEERQEDSDKVENTVDKMLGNYC